MLVDFSIVPLDQGLRLGDFVAQILKIVKDSGISFRLQPMGTVIEGEPDQIWSLLRRCQDKATEMSQRVITTIKIDDFKGRKGAITEKTQIVEEKLGEKLT